MNPRWWHLLLARGEGARDYIIYHSIIKFNLMAFVIWRYFVFGCQVSRELKWMIFNVVSSQRNAANRCRLIKLLLFIFVVHQLIAFYANSFFMQEWFAARVCAALQVRHCPWVWRCKMQSTANRLTQTKSQVLSKYLWCSKSSQIYATFQKRFAAVKPSDSSDFQLHNQQLMIINESEILAPRWRQINRLLVSFANRINRC